MQRSDMNMIKNPTPGPWSLDGRAAGGDLDIVAPSSRIAMMDCERDDDTLVTADARLIAAAPDMLEALQVAVADIEVRARLGLEAPAWYAQGRAAIDKAIGEG